MGGTSVIQGNKLSQAELMQKYKPYLVSQSSPILPLFDLLQAKDGSESYIAKCSVRANQQQAKLFKLRNGIKSSGLPALDYVQQQQALCGGSSNFTSFFEYYPETLAEQNRRNLIKKNSFCCDDIAKMAHQTLKILTPMHLAGYAHQNIRPQNIQFSPQSQLKLLDSPLVTGLTAYDYSRRQKKASYLSPQQLKDFKAKQESSKANKFKSDIFALGLVLLEMFTQRSHEELYLDDRFDTASVQLQLSKMSSSCSFELVDKLKMMLKENEEQRRSADRLLRMFNEMQNRKSIMPRESTLDVAGSNRYPF